MDIQKRNNDKEIYAPLKSKWLVMKPEEKVSKVAENVQKQTGNVTENGRKVAENHNRVAEKVSENHGKVTEKLREKAAALGETLTANRIKILELMVEDPYFIYLCNP